MELRLYIPTAWNQLNKKQLLYMASLYTWNHGEQDFLIKALMFLSGLKLTGIQHPESSIQHPESSIQHPESSILFTHPSIKQPVAITDEQLAIMADKCRYLLTIGEINPVKWIGLARARHPRLYNATLEEYLMAENYYFAYTKTRDEQHLHNLMAVLYRYPWQRWNAEHIQRRAQKFRNVEKDIQSSVFMWYVGFRSFIPKRCPTLFSGTGAGQSFDARSYITGIVHQLNNGDITLNDKLMKSPVWYALDELEQRAKQNEAEIKAIKNRKHV